MSGVALLLPEVYLVERFHSRIEVHPSQNGRIERMAVRDPGDGADDGWPTLIAVPDFDYARYDEAVTASKSYFGRTDHPFMNCFVCGPAHGRKITNLLQKAGYEPAKNAENADIGGHVFLRDGFGADGHVVFFGAHVGGGVSCRCRGSVCLGLCHSCAPRIV